MFLWTRRNELCESHFSSNIVLTVIRGGLLALQGDYVLPEIFSHFILEPFPTHCRPKIPQLCCASCYISNQFYTSDQAKCIMDDFFPCLCYSQKNAFAGKFALIFFMLRSCLSRFSSLDLISILFSQFE